MHFHSDLKSNLIYSKYTVTVPLTLLGFLILLFIFSFDFCFILYPGVIQFLGSFKKEFCFLYYRYFVGLRIYKI